MLRSILLAGIGGAAGSILRYLCGVFVQRHYASTLPLATFLVNISGCLMIGCLMGSKIISGHNDYRVLLVTGLCGGYTTFSAFAWENIQLLRNGQTTTALGYILLSTVMGLAAVWAGTMLVRNAG